MKFTLSYMPLYSQELVISEPKFDDLSIDSNKTTNSSCNCNCSSNNSSSNNYSLGFGIFILSLIAIQCI